MGGRELWEDGKTGHGMTSPAENSKNIKLGERQCMSAADGIKVCVPGESEADDVEDDGFECVIVGG